MTPTLTTLSSLYWKVWLALVALSTALWLGSWAIFSTPGPLYGDLPLSLSFLIPEGLAVWLAPRATLSHFLFPLPAGWRWAAGLWLGWLAAWSLYLWFGLIGSLGGALLFIWLSTPHLLAKKRVI